jgi:hypothetical protein
MAQRKDDLAQGKGLDIGGAIRGGGFGGGARYARGAFEMPKDVSGQSQQLNRQGVTKAPVKKLESNAESYVKSLSEADKRAMQEKAFPRINQTPPPGKLKQRQALRGEEFERRYDAARETRDAARQARKDKFGIKFEKGGMVRGQCRDYGK